MSRTTILHRDPSTSTGLGLSGGGALCEADLPDAKIEVHLFRSSDAAGSFAAGLALAKRNDMTWTWQVGTRHGNKAVIVAIASEPRSYAVVRHDYAAIDAEAHRKAMEEIHRQRRIDEEIARASTAPLREAAAKSGLMLYDYGRDWARLDGVLASIEARGTMLSADDEHHGSDDEARDRYGEACAPGVSYDRAERAFTAGPVDGVEATIAAIGAIKASVKAAERLRKAIWHERFMASMTLSGARLKFMRAAAEHGIAFGWSRGNSKGRSGGLEIGATEAERLVRAGWIVKDGLAGSVTDAGRAAIAAATKEAK